MSLKIKDVAAIIENYAPIKYKESYDNVGLMIGDREAVVSNILIALDCTMNVIEEAKNKECNLIINHHPILFLKPSTITKDSLIGNKIIEIIKGDINVYAAHTNLDSARGGLNDIFMELLEFKNYKTIELSKANDSQDEISGVGRIIDLEEEITLENLCLHVKNKLELSNLKYSGAEETKIRKIAVVNGSGEDYFKLSKSLGADCIITGDTTYHYVSDYREEGMCIIDAGHFETEWPIFKLYSQTLIKELKNNGFCNDVYISEETKPAYKYLRDK